MTELIRSAALNGVPELARSLGLQVDSLIAAVGIDRRALVDPEFRVSAHAVAELLELAAAQSGVDTFAVRLAETRQLSITGPVGMLMRDEATVGDAFRSMQKYLRVHNEAVVFHLDRVDDQAVISGGPQLARKRAYRQSTEMVFGVLMRTLQSLIGRHWFPVVCFTHEPPARLDDHRRLFGPRIDFRANYNGFIFPWSDLERPIPGADPQFAAQARRYLDSLVARSGETFRDKVSQLLHMQLQSGRCTSDRLAQQLGCDRRTLHRRLAGESTTFDAILNDVRTEHAVRLLQNRDASLAEAADLLGFSSGSAFSRWFLAAFGRRPSEWRKDFGAGATQTGATGANV